MRMTPPAGGSCEERAEALLRLSPLAAPAITLLVAGTLYAGIGVCLRLFQSGYQSVAILSGLLLHAYVIVVVHDGAHRAITRTRADSLLMNVGAGLVLLPFYAEPFRRYHLIHHGHTNEPVDPLWPPLKSFPLGMGIGNHEAHHQHPGFSWVSMAFGLARRPKDTDPLRTVWWMLRCPDYRHYSASCD